MFWGMNMQCTTARRAAIMAGLAFVALGAPGARAEPAAAATPPAAVIAPAPAAPTGAEEGARVWRYAVNWGPASLAKVSITLTEDGDETVLSGDGHGAGFMLLLSDFAITQTGRYGPEGPREFLSLGRVGDEHTNRRVTFAPGEDPQTETLVAPPDDDQPRTPIPEGALTGAVDPMFPILAAMRKMDAGDGCAGDHRVYTGRTAFQMTLRDLGSETLEGDRDWTWSGPARRCSISMRRIGGFRVKTNWWEQDEADMTRDIWFAALPAGAAPVRLRIEGPLGFAIGRIDLR